MSGQFKGILLSAICVIFAIVLLPTVIEQTTTVMGTANLADYTGTSSFVKLLPLLTVVGLIIVAVFNTMYTVRKNRKAKKHR